MRVIETVRELQQLADAERAAGHRIGLVPTMGALHAGHLSLVEEAGAFAVVLEGMPVELAREVTELLSIPTIGIGAGVHCDGQVLVMHDLLGLSDWTPSFVKQYANLGALASRAARSFAEDVAGEKFPDEEHSYR